MLGSWLLFPHHPHRALGLLRQQVKLQAANAFKAAAALASVPGANNQTAAERAYQILLARGMGGGAIRNLTDTVQVIPSQFVELGGTHGVLEFVCVCKGG